MSVDIVGAGAGTGIGGKERILDKLVEIFGLPPNQAAIFFQLMDVTITQYPNQYYFQSILNMIPVPKFHVNRTRAAKENEINAAEYNFSIFYDPKYSKGQYGTVKPNRSRTNYVYKFVNVKIGDNESIKNILKEPLINVILQEDATVQADICKLYKVYCKPIITIRRNMTGYEGIPEEDYMYNKNIPGPVEEEILEGYELIYKLENLGPPVWSILEKQLEKVEGSEKNLRILLKIYGPLYKVLAYLREAYQFEHGDLHYNNLMFEKNPIQADGTLDESLLKVKMIDFGFSSLEFAGEKIGIPHPRHQKEVYLFLWAANKKYLPQEFIDKLLSYGEDYLAMEKFIMEESAKVSGGRRKNSRNKRNKRKTRKNRWNV